MITEVENQTRKRNLILEPIWISGEYMEIRPNNSKWDVDSESAFKI